MTIHWYYLVLTIISHLNFFQYTARFTVCLLGRQVPIWLSRLFNYFCHSPADAAPFGRVLRLYLFLFHGTLSPSSPISQPLPVPSAHLVDWLVPSTCGSNYGPSHSTPGKHRDPEANEAVSVDRLFHCHRHYQLLLLLPLLLRLEEAIPPLS